MNHFAAVRWSPTIQYVQLAETNGITSRSGNSTSILDPKYAGTEYIEAVCSRSTTLRSLANVDRTVDVCVSVPASPLPAPADTHSRSCCRRAGWSS